MVHERRIFHVTSLPQPITPSADWSESLAQALTTVDELAEKLTGHTWTLCTAFALGQLLFLNDAFSADGAQEYAVVKGGYQIESVTFSWATRAEARGYINGLVNGSVGKRYRACQPCLNESPRHRCALCA